MLMMSVRHGLIAVMIIFVVGYCEWHIRLSRIWNAKRCCLFEAWIDTHLAVTANSGVGYSLFWKRVLLVMIGFTAGTHPPFRFCPYTPTDWNILAAFVIMCFPKITSARTTVRKTACHIK